MTVTVLGPQRRPTVRPVAGTAATVTAGWREREADDAELDGLLGGGTVNLRLHARWLDVLDADPELATAELNHRAVLEELQDLYAVQVEHAEQAVAAIRRSSTRPRTLTAVLADAEAALRLLDQRHLERVAAARADFDAAWHPAERDAVARHRAEVAEVLAGTGTLVVTGGHVGVLLHVLRLFAVTPPADVLAWSAGAMALTDRVVLFTDGRAETYAPGLGLVPDTVLLPHARRRLPVDDPVRLGALARRFAPARCVVLDDGATLATSRAIEPDGRLAGPADPRPIEADPRPTEADPAEPGDGPVTASTRRLAINRLKERGPLDGGAVDRFLHGREVPIIEGLRCTFLFRGEADEVWVTHRVLGLPDRLPLRRLRGTDLWSVVMELPERSRVEYQIEIRRGDAYERVNDPLNPHRSHSPVGSSSVVFATGYQGPEWAEPDPETRPGELVELTVPSRALNRDARVTLYLPARFRRTAAYPLLVVHDGPDYLQYAAAKTVLDNLLHRNEVAELVAAFLHPGDRLAEYADSTAHARFVTGELLPFLERRFPLAGAPAGRCLMGASFGAVAALSTAYRHPDTYGSLLLQSGSFVFTDIGSDHGGGPVFDPVVRFTNRYRARPRAVADRVFVSCGVYEPLIVRNRSMVPVLSDTGMRVRYVESRDGHSWENWRDRLRDGLSYVFPGPRKYVYE